jgi:mono/diheme cytochrome c family protein
MSRQLTVFAAAAALVFCTAVATAADPASGKAEVDKVCGACHQPADWKGKNAGEIETQIKGVLAGKTKHPKKLVLTDAQIADVAAYWASGS